MLDLLPITIDEVIAELFREVDQRDHAYPIWIEDGRITPKIAARRIALIQRAAALCCGLRDLQALLG